MTVTGVRIDDSSRVGSVIKVGRKRKDGRREQPLQQDSGHSIPTKRLPLSSSVPPNSATYCTPHFRRWLMPHPIQTARPTIRHPARVNVSSPDVPLLQHGPGCTVERRDCHLPFPELTPADTKPKPIGTRSRQVAGANQLVTSIMLAAVAQSSHKSTALVLDPEFTPGARK